jgi:hypothetical protein
VSLTRKRKAKDWRQTNGAGGVDRSDGDGGCNYDDEDDFVGCWHVIRVLLQCWLVWLEPKVVCGTLISVGRSCLCRVKHPRHLDFGFPAFPRLLIQVLDFPKRRCKLPVSVVDAVNVNSFSPVCPVLGNTTPATCEIEVGAIKRH